jgi:hypothetical protein
MTMLPKDLYDGLFKALDLGVLIIDAKGDKGTGIHVDPTEACNLALDLDGSSKVPPASLENSSLLTCPLLKNPDSTASKAAARRRPIEVARLLVLAAHPWGPESPMRQGFRVHCSSLTLGLADF